MLCMLTEVCGMTKYPMDSKQNAIYVLQYSVKSAIAFSDISRLFYLIFKDLYNLCSLRGSSWN